MGLEGALVMDVTEGSGADKAGILPTRRSSNGDIVLGDLIVEINDDPVRSNNELLLTLEKYKSGDQVNVKVKRKDQSTTLTVILGSMH
jgi:S1-C subfamily serine protease